MTEEPKKSFADVIDDSISVHGDIPLELKKNSRIRNKYFSPRGKSEEGRTILVSALKEKFNNVYAFLIGIGLEQPEIETIFGLGRSGLYNQLERSPELAETKAKAMAELEHTLMAYMLRAAIGYDYTEEEIEYKKVVNPKVKYPVNDKVKMMWIENKKKVFTRHQPGNASMFLSFMYNRFPENWKNSSEIVSKKEGYDSDPKLRVRKIIESLGRAVLEADTDKSKTERSVPNEPARVPDSGQ